MGLYSFYKRCVDFAGAEVNALIDMIHGGISITRKTFLKHVDPLELKKLEKALGYEAKPADGLTMAEDFHVSYHRGTLDGQRVYYFKHSAIEYVFRPE